MRKPVEIEDVDLHAERRRFMQQRFDRAYDTVDLRQPGVGDDQDPAQAETSFGAPRAATVVVAVGSGAARRQMKGSMEARSLEVGAALNRAHAEPHAATVAHDLDRDFDAGGAAGPACHDRISASEPTTASPTAATISPRRRPAGPAGLRSRNSGNDHASITFRAIDADPWPSRPIEAAVVRSCARSGGSRSIGTIMLTSVGCPVRRRSRHARSRRRQAARRRRTARRRPRTDARRGENGVIEQIFPIAGEFVLGDDARLDELPPAARGDHHRVADLRFLRSPERDRGKPSRSSAWTRPQSGFLVDRQRVSRNQPAARRVNQIVSASVTR